MKSNNKKNIDGFVIPRRQPGQDNGIDHKLAAMQPGVPERFLDRPDVNTKERESPTVTPEKNVGQLGGLRRAEIDESLQAIDVGKQNASKKKRRFRFSWNKIPKKRIAIIAILLLVILVGFFIVRLLLAGGRAFNGNLLDLLGSGTPLQTDKDGYSNIVVFGTSEDDPSHQDSGAGPNLTDSIMVVSINQSKKTAAMVSIPRDLWVKYGQACNSGYEGKINEVFICNGGENNERKGAQGLMSMVGDVTGLDIQYYVHVNYTVVKDLVDAVGGVDVKIESDDSRGVLDRNFDWICRYQCYKVKYANGIVRLDGEYALYLARARGDYTGYPSYGFSGGNFDREQYQQKIMIAIKDKMLQAGTLANPVAITKIADGLGNNVRTNFSAGEVKTLVKIAGEMGNNIKRISLVGEKNPVVTTGNYGDASIVRPVLGMYNYSGIASYIKSQRSASNDLAVENATVMVLNGSDFAGKAGEEASKLTSAGIPNVQTGDTATEGSYGNFVWYDLSGGKMPKTKAKIESTLSVAPKATTLPAGVQSNANFVIIVGNGVN